MMRVLAVALALVPQVGLAFSCPISEIWHAYELASQSEPPDQVVLGSFYFDPSAEQETRGADGLWNGTQFEATFSGQILLPDGFQDVSPAPVTFDVDCGDGWCGGKYLNERIYFLSVEEGQYRMTAATCGSPIFRISPGTVELFEMCASSEGCDPNH